MSIGIVTASSHGSGSLLSTFRVLGLACHLLIKRATIGGFFRVSGFQAVGD